MPSKIFAVVLILISVLLLTIPFLLPLELPVILALVLGAFFVALFGVVTFRHGFISAVRASHKGQPEYRK